MSSSNIQMELEITDGNSFTNIRNSKGPRIDPWGIPLITGSGH